MALDAMGDAEVRLRSLQHIIVLTRRLRMQGPPA